MVLLLTNDNHLSNVKSLQSIYKQDYPNIYLVVCNDCTDHFQSERLFYNYEAGRPENVQGVYVHENVHPLGEYCTQKQFWDHAKADYVVALHSGEYFVSPQALSQCVKQLEYDHSVAALLVGAELWSNDMKKCETVYAAVNQRQPQFLTSLEQAAVKLTEIRDCMLICRLKDVRALEFSEEQSGVAVGANVLTALLSDKRRVMMIPQTLCKFSELSIEDEKKAVPDTYGNKRIQNISELLKEESAQRDSGEKDRLFGGNPMGVAPSQETSRWLKLYKYSRFSKLKSYAVLDLLTIICAVLMLMTNHPLLSVAGAVVLAGSVLLLCWTMAMLVVNLYLKKNPQRLVS